MGVTREQVEHVARLARLRLSAQEVERYTAQLNGILRHVEALGALDVQAVDAVGGVADGPARLRADEPGADALLAPPADIAVAWEEGFFTVPRLAALGGDLEDVGE